MNACHAIFQSLTNPPAVFQWFVNTIFADLLDVCVIIYLDEVLLGIHQLLLLFH